MPLLLHILLLLVPVLLVILLDWHLEWQWQICICLLCCVLWSIVSLTFAAKQTYYFPQIPTTYICLLHQMLEGKGRISFRGKLWRRNFFCFFHVFLSVNYYYLLLLIISQLIFFVCVAYIYVVNDHTIKQKH